MRARLFVACFGCITAWGLLPASAGTVSDRAVDGLFDARCPAQYRVLHARDFTPQQVADARAGRFKVHRTVVTLDPPVDWRQDPEGSRIFRHALHRLAWLDPLFFAYRDGDLGALRQARALVLDWIAANPRGRSPRAAWLDKVAGDRAPYLAYLTRAAACEGIIGRTRARLLLDALAGHARFLSHPRIHRSTNHGLFVDLGLTLLGSQLPFMRAADEWTALGERRFARVLASRTIAGEHFWLEHSANYHLGVRSLLARFLELTGSRDPRLTGLLTEMTEVAGWLVEPDDRVVQLGDSHLEAAPPEIAAAGERDEGILWLPQTGLAVVKHQLPASYLSLAATFHSPVHKHSDELTFDLYEHGRRIVSDTGLYEKDPGPYRRFSRAARAHSVLTVDGMPFPREADDAYGGALLARGEGDGWYALAGSNPLLRQAGVGHTRTLLLRPGEALWVIDRVRSSSPHEYTRFFHLGPGVDAAGSGSGAELTAPGFVGRLRSEVSRGPERLGLVRGQATPLQGFTFPAFRVAEPRWTARLNTRGEDLDHLTVFDLSPGPAPNPRLGGRVRRDGFELELRLAGQPAGRLVVARDGETLTIDETVGP